MSSLLLAEDIAAVDGLLPRIAATAAQALPDALCCGIIVAAGAENEVRPAAASGQLAERADVLQCKAGDGPSLDCLSTGAVLEIADAGTEDRWTGFGSAMTSLGAGAAIFLPLRVDGTVLGVLNVYRDRARRYTGAEILAAGVLADQAAVIFVAANRFAALAERNRHLEKALDSRATIDQAVGIIMATQHCTAPEALETLRRTSRYRNHKVRDIAATIVATTGRAARSTADSAEPHSP
ncbi:MAG TPA: GAF and ANTAR domain-containing protein [Mycobacteriales bacterium]|jgi:GAF domain-containing protein|nr:GAF and ANTAR domain-containing protein [Mycobacteriales bacterium]